jgi:Ca2+-transporting ATPase
MDLVSDLIFVGIVCFDNPIREGVLDAIKKIQGAGIAVRLCTGDHPATASSIAKKCGIYMGTPGDLVEGPALATWVMKRDLTSLRILARASPENKAYVVSALQGLDRVVAFLGDGVNDQLALKAANVSFSMAVTGMEVAKQASHIAILNDDLGSVVKVLTWGRCLRDSRGQFHNIHNANSLTLFIVIFVSAVASPTMKPALSLVQLLWITVLVIPLTTALGLSTDRPSELWLENHAYLRLSSYSSYVWRCIAQTCVILFLLLFKLPGHSSTESLIDISDRTRTLIFNTLAFMLIIYCSVNWTLGSGRSLRKVNRTFAFVLVIGEEFCFND